MQIRKHIKLDDNPSVSNGPGAVRYIGAKTGVPLKFERVGNAVTQDSKGYLYGVGTAAPRFWKSEYAENLCGSDWMISSQDLTKDAGFDTVTYGNTAGGLPGIEGISSYVECTTGTGGGSASSRVWGNSGVSTQTESRANKNARLMYRVLARLPEPQTSTSTDNHHIFFEFDGHATHGNNARCWFDIDPDNPSAGLVQSTGDWVEATATSGVKLLSNRWVACWIIFDHEDDSQLSWFIGASNSDGTSAADQDGSRVQLVGWQISNVSDPNLTDGNSIPYVNNKVLSNLAWCEPRGTNQGLLGENPATNEVLYSEDFSNAAWVKTNCTITQNGALGPNGHVSMSTLTASAAGTAYIRDTWTATASTQYCFSVYAKPGLTNFIYIRVIGLGAGDRSVYYDLSDGSVGTTGAAVESTYVESMADGSYRVSFVFTSDATDTSGSYSIELAEADGDLNLSSGSFSVNIWGAQLEALDAGSSTLTERPTSYIRTLGASVTRGKDEAYIDEEEVYLGTNEDSWGLAMRFQWIPDSYQRSGGAVMYLGVGPFDGPALSGIQYYTVSGDSSRATFWSGGSQSSIAWTSNSNVRTDQGEDIWSLYTGNRGTFNTYHITDGAAVDNEATNSGTTSPAGDLDTIAFFDRESNNGANTCAVREMMFFTDLPADSGNEQLLKDIVNGYIPGSEVVNRKRQRDSFRRRYRRR